MLRGMTLTRYVLQQLLVSFAFALAGLGLVILPTLTVNAVHEVGGVGFAAILDYMPLVLIELVPYVLPLAFLLAVVATFGRLAADNELTAIRMAGTHPARLLLPGVLLAVLLTGATDWLLSSVAPTWKYEARHFLRAAEVEEFKRLLFERNEIDHKNFSLWAESSNGNVKENVVLSFQQEDEDGGPGGAERTTVTAERLVLEIDEEYLNVRLENAELVNDSVQSRTEAFDLPFAMKDLVTMRVPDRDVPKYMTSAQMAAALQMGDVDPEREAEMRYLIQSRHALAMTYLLFLLLGAPTGIFLRAGTQLAAFTGAMGYAFVYYLLALRLGKQLAAGGAVAPELAAWSTDAIFLVLGLAMTWRGLLR